MFGSLQGTKNIPVEVPEFYDANPWAFRAADGAARPRGRTLSQFGGTSTPTPEPSATPAPTEYGFYGFYGFYGVNLPVTIDCDVLVLKFKLYNYGARDLTHVNTIRYIIDNTREAIDSTYLQAVPTGNKENFEATVTELDGSAVTYVVVTVEVNFQAGNLSPRSAREAGGTFASFLGVSAADQSSSGGYAPASPAPTTGKGSVGIDIVVTDYTADDILDDENELISFQAVVQSSVQKAVKESVGSSAADGVTTQLIGLVEAGESDSAVAARVYVYFADKDDAKEFKDKLENDSSSSGLDWGPLDGRLKVVMTVSTSGATFTDAHGREVQVRPSSSSSSSGSSSSSRHRRMLVSSSEEDSGTIISKNLARAGLGVNSMDPSALECKISDGHWDSDSDGSPKKSSSSDIFEDASSSFYGVYGHDASLYGFYGSASSEISSGSKPSSAVTSSAGSFFYGYSPVAESESDSQAPGITKWGSKSSALKRPPSSKPWRPSSSSPPGTSPAAVEPPAPMEEEPVYFTTILADYNMADLATTQDMAQFRSDYIHSVEASLRMLGIASDPHIAILDVLPASVAVPTVVTFINDPDGARLFSEVLQSNPSLAFPAFSGLGEITIVDVSTGGNAGDFRAGEDKPARLGPVIQGPESGDKGGSSDKVDPVPDSSAPSVVAAPCPITRSGETCCAPAALDAKVDCCWKGVDECGVCGGRSDTCATSAAVRVQAARPGLTSSTSSAAFESMLEDFSSGVANLFGSFGTDASDVAVDGATVSSRRTDTGALEFDIPFLVNPYAPQGPQGSSASRSPPTLSMARSILTAAAESNLEADGMTIIALLDVARSGVCGNQVCELGEFLGADGHSPASSCPADCPAFVGCPVGTVTSPDGSVSDPDAVCSGHGQCASSSGECRCHVGYTGNDCSSCSEGYASETPGGPCVLVRVNEATTDNGKGGSGTREAPGAEGTEGSKGWTWGAIFLTVILVVLVGSLTLFLYYCCVIRARGRQRDREDGLAAAASSPAYGTIAVQEPLQVPIVSASAEPDIPTRQMTEHNV